MSRPHIPAAPPAGRPAAANGAADQVPQSWPAPTGGRAPRQLNQPAQPAYAPYPPQAEVPPFGEAHAPDPYAQGAAPGGAYPYAQQPYDPYGQPQPAYGQPQAQGFGGAGQGLNFDQWPGPDRRALDLASYTPANSPAPGPDYGAGRHAHHHFTPPHTAGDWGAPSAYGHHHGLDGGHEPAPYASRGHASGLEQTYADDDPGYDVPEPRRGRKMLSVLVVAVVVGGGLAYAYLGLVGSKSDGTPPVVKSADGPFKVKPSDPGGKQFAHTDSKIMGRLGDSAGSESTSRSDDTDGTGARKVSTLVVGRDGSIRAPEASESSRPTVSVPGLTVVDGLGGGRPAGAPKASPAASEPQEPVVVSPPAAEPKKPVVIAKAVPSSADDGDNLPDVSSALDTSSPAPSPPARKTETAAAPPTAAEPQSTTTPAAADPAPPQQTTGLGYVAVLASVPASASSRMDALKQFADMQEKYGSLLQDKTPDVKEANLGAKGTYHRLLVGPPGSRDAASALCIQLKAQGYRDCWVTAY